MDEQTKIELESAAFRTLIDHLRNRTDVQNIDMMNSGRVLQKLLIKMDGSCCRFQRELP